MKTYIDEAGNTGSDLKQKAQPFFILSAITLSDTNTDVILKELETQFISHKEKEELEIKAVKWCKSSKKASALQRIIEKIIHSNGHISVVIIEKRYMISAMIVDNFFDPVYNDIKDYKWINDTNKKIAAVNYFYSNLTDDIVYKLWDSIQTLSAVDLHNILDEIIQIISNKEYLSLLKGAYNHVDELIYELNLREYADKNHFNNSAIRSPNYTAFPAVMNPVITYCRVQKSNTHIIFDDAQEFNQSYEHIYNIFSSIKSDVPTPNGMLYSWCNVSSFQASKSEVDKGLQLADIVSSSVNQIMTKTLNDKIISDYDLFIAALLIALDRNYKSAWYVVSTQFYKKYFETLQNSTLNL